MNRKNPDLSVLYLRIPHDLRDRVKSAAKSFDSSRRNNINRMIGELLEKEYGGSDEDV